MGVILKARFGDVLMLGAYHGLCIHGLRSGAGYVLTGASFLTAAVWLQLLAARVMGMSVCERLV